MRRLVLVMTVMVVGGCGQDHSGSVDAATRDGGAEGDAAVEPETCESPGAIETVACGMCGTRERVCEAGIWAGGACTGEGECAPGAVDTVACGRCGTRAVRCTDACAWEETGACTDEGECAPGDVMRTSSGCPDGESRLARCTDACAFETEGECSSSPIDVMLLLDTTGANTSYLRYHEALFLSDLVRPLLELPDVAVGVSTYAEFPGAPYGADDDRPFEGGVEPVRDESMIVAALEAAPGRSGGDWHESGVEALSVLTGGTLPSSAVPLDCSTGRVAGGCWRPGATQVIIVYTDAANHNGPDPYSAGLASPYSGISPAPAEWPDVRARMMSDGTILLVLLRASMAVATEQHALMLSDLGQPASDLVDAESLAPAFATVVSRVRALATP